MASIKIADWAPMRGPAGQFSRALDSTGISLRASASSWKLFPEAGAAAADKGMEKIFAKVPLKEMNNYSISLSSNTRGRASFSMKFASYELLPSDVQDALLKEYEKSKVAE